MSMSFEYLQQTLSRRQLLGAVGAGFGTLALADLLRAEQTTPSVVTPHTAKIGRAHV